MDDLKLLRDLGARLEHEPPVTLVRQRERLLRARATRRWWATWWTAGLVAVATAAAVVVPTLLLARDRPVAVPPAAARNVDVSGAMNILLVGSDSVEGENAAYGPHRARQPDGGGRRSDSIIILHVPEDRGAVTAVSVPRDSMVRIQGCPGRPARTDMINSAYDQGGLPCLRQTLQKLTGLTFRHTVEVDYTGFKGVVDALGGVQLTLSRPVDDPRAKLRLPAGKVTLDGEAALGWMRSRATGDGSDTARIKRQAQLLRAMAKKAQSSVLDENRLKALLTEVRASVRTDLGLEEMAGLAGQLASARISMAVVPWQPSRTDPNRIEWRQPQARELFESLK
ncbi:Putative transcriptional regulator YvhJ [Nonomuraea coxensis DSM 45129]|uniref:Transcriptional regulator YvhJ n=1 Tax=Nonomuraea coxensis DSM 45129 TaxID=1122611 RepID=A0ABX8TTH6_9ACTN|nr:LCP family protein [Nonomuraea coxensis]QYC38026.1 Putative transcriptional regulator YvhJ [Nonomuraea coxensis DSM 45129]